MNSYVFNEKTGRYEQLPGLLTGKSAAEIAAEYGISRARSRQYAYEKNLPYLGDGTNAFIYIFDAAAEEAFINRKIKPGPKAIEKPLKIPNKPGRPRKEKPANTASKNPVGRPRKNPIETLNVIPKRNRGRPRKK
jgi:hypothetical protein